MQLLEKVKYVYDDELWFFPVDLQIHIIFYWDSKINSHNKKLYYINPNISLHQTR